MNIVVTGRRMNVSDELRDFVESQIDNATKVFKIDPMTIEVVLRRDVRSNRVVFACEITLRTKGHIIRTEASDEDVKTAVDIATAKLERQLRKFKTKVIDKRQNAPRLTDAIELVRPVPDYDDETVYESDDGELVRIKEIELSVLNTDEALLQMDMLGHDFFVYVAAEDGTTRVMYRRNEGGYGLICPRLESVEG
ncbi:MAG: ribosome-associated translation inhibitor RaiA [Coriobacteriia bacterium]|nr:ribosome-associated translation inhibitor RaiA [Coriobacteriia bacterium]